MNKASQPVLLVSTAAFLSGTFVALASGQTVMNERTLFEFDTPNSVKEWTLINDTVMGGVSASDRRVNEDGKLEFSGSVSLDNNGGFASLRAGTNSLNLSPFDEFVLRVRGDGKRYAFSVQTDYPIMAGAYYFSFQTNAGNWQEIHAPMRAFEPRSFGRPVRGAPALNASDIRSLGLIISDKQEGPFRLETDWIKAAKDVTGHTPKDALADHDTGRKASELIRKAISRGAPLFNAGQPEACARVYEIAADCIVTLSTGNLPPEVAETLAVGLAKAERTADSTVRAWALRDAFDSSLRILGEDQPTKESPHE
jgi:monofunctional biosynthetic peptidoglycan transglycosylase